jgi:hypothetical protein
MIIMYMKCEFNTVSGRCRNGTKQSRKCERNKKTKRCRKKKTKTHAKPQTPMIKLTTSGCSPGKFRNPATNRCVSKKGVIGKKIFTTDETTVIGGPISLNYFEFQFQGVKRKLLSLGDEHTKYRYPNEKTVITLPTFLKKIVRQSPHCIDLFVENAVYQRQKLATGKQLTKHTDPLNAVRQEFYGCPYHNFKGRKCPYDNLRYHNWDMRFENPLVKHGPGEVVQPKQGYSWKSNPYDLVFFELTKDQTVHTALRNIPKEKMIRYILGLDKNASDTQDIDAFFEMAFEKLSIVANNEISERSFQEYRKQVVKQAFTKLKKHTRFPKNFLNTFIKVYKREIGNNMTDYTTVFTDFYMLCRMFQKYKKKQRGPKDCRDVDRCKYMILYAGDSHNQKVHAFLIEMFGHKALMFGTGGHYNKKINIPRDIFDVFGDSWFNNVDDLIRFFIN